MGLLGNSLMVEQRTLTPSILVRIQVPQPILVVAYSLPAGFVYFDARFCTNLFSFK